MRRVAPLFTILLCACAAMSPVRAVEATADGVSFAYVGDRQAEATRQATLYCANLGRSVALRDVQQQHDDSRVAVFDCR
jgi:hypothetical protein